MLHRSLSTVVAVCPVPCASSIRSVIAVVVEREGRYVPVQGCDVGATTAGVATRPIIAKELHAPTVLNQMSPEATVATKGSRVRACVRTCLEIVRRWAGWRRRRRRRRRRRVWWLQRVGVGQRSIFDVANWAVRRTVRTNATTNGALDHVMCVGGVTVRDTVSAYSVA